MALDRLPPTVEELIEQLDEEFPSRTLSHSDLDKTERLIWMEAGMRYVVDVLKGLLDEVHSDIDED